MAGYVYVVDFESMLQQRQNDPSRKRQVKRDLSTTPKKGVAGLRIDGSTESSSSSSLSNYQIVETNLISTIAATDAAIRIASNIIDSTLAHADRNDSNDGDSRRASGSSGSTSSTIRRELLNEVEETLNISNSSSIGSSPNLEDFFSTTIDEFRSLALSNIAESDNDSDDDVRL